MSFRGFIAAVLNAFFIIIISFFCMIYGWGLEPQNLGIIFGGYASVLIIPAIINFLISK